MPPSRLRLSDFNPCDYLPKNADWQEFFNDLVAKGDAELRLRTYWYVVVEIDFWPYGIQKLLNAKNFAVLETVLRKSKPNCTVSDAISDSRIASVHDNFSMLLQLSSCLQPQNYLQPVC